MPRSARKTESDEQIPVPTSVRGACACGTGGGGAWPPPWRGPSRVPSWCLTCTNSTQKESARLGGERSQRAMWVPMATTATPRGRGGRARVRRRG